MDKAMFASIVGIVGGVVFIIFHKGMAAGLTAWQKDNFNSNFGKREEIMHARGFLAMGIAFIIFGVLVATGVIQ